MIFYLKTCIGLLTFVITTAQRSNSQLHQCFIIPAYPMNGKFTIKGLFFVRFTCPSKDMDLPLNAPGDGGILTCDPKVVKNFDIISANLSASPPLCLKIRYPEKLRISIVLTYAVPECSLKSHVLTEIEHRQTNLKSVLDSACQPIKCYWLESEVECAKSKIFSKPKLGSQLDVTLTIETDYDSKVTIEAYLEIQDKIRSALKVKDDTEIGRHQWRINDIALVYSEFGPWVSSCGNHPFTAGSNLALNRIASCRGCPHNFFFNSQMAMCEQCPYQQMTKTPFSGACEDCPPEVEWGNARQKFLELCFQRQ